MFDFAYDFLNRLFKTAQAPGTLDVCQGCNYNEDGKCTFTGDAMNIQLPIGCPKRSDTAEYYASKEIPAWRGNLPEAFIVQQSAHIRNPSNWEVIPVKKGEQLIVEDYISDAYGKEIVVSKENNEDFLDITGNKVKKGVIDLNEFSDRIFNLLFQRSSSLKRKGQAFAPGPGPWEGRQLPIQETEVSRQSPERSGFGPFVSRSPILARMDILRSAEIIAQAAHMQLGSGGNSIASIKSGQLDPNALPQQNVIPPEVAQPEQGMQRCPRCGAQIAPGQQTCPNCGWSASMEENQMQQTRQQTAPPLQQPMAKKAQYPIGYFCGEPVTGPPYTLILNNEGDKQLGVDHLECAQTAEENQQGSFDEQYDFRVFEDFEKEKPSFEEEEQDQFEANDEVVLVEDFENLDIGDIGRVISDQEAEEAGISNIRVDNQVNVIFDKDMDKIMTVPIDVLEKTSKIKKIARQLRCPFNHVPTVEIVMDHCILATDDPDDIFGCHDKRCKFHQPTSLEEWKRLVDTELAQNPTGYHLEYWHRPMDTWKK